MSTNTSHYLITKPAGTENVSRQVINNNYDVIDGAIFSRVQMINVSNISIPATADSAIGSTILSTTIDLSDQYLAGGRIYGVYVVGDYNHDQLTDNSKFEVFTRVSSDYKTVYINCVRTKSGSIPSQFLRVHIVTNEKWRGVI